MIGAFLALNDERLLQLLERANHATAGLRALRGTGPEELVRDEFAFRAIKYRLVVAIEAYIDAARRISTMRQLASTASYADTFRSLERAGFLSPSVAAFAQDMVRVRDGLVRRSVPVRDATVVGVLDRLDGFDRLRTELVAAAE